MMTLILSKAPIKNSISIESQNDRDNPKTIVAPPNPATAKIKVQPAFRIGARWAMNNDIRTAPMDGAARIQPKPVGPTCKISLA